MQTIFEKYGGFAQVSAVVAAFYDKVLESPALAPYFAGADMSALMVHQAKFMAQAMGGPPSHTWPELRHAHARLRITPQDFDEMLVLLRQTLSEAGFSEDDLGAVCRAVAVGKPYIVIQ
ncbi:MAG: group 1 truncated hemoglobin [Pseudorhodoplanes sp.]|nr:group 1 truncated hemoglobin [Pseudorhodoplanes sp.]